jgi:hypothetical protein
MKWLILSAAGLVMLLAMAACGGDGGGAGSEEDQIRQLNQDFMTYFKEERWSKIHDLYSEEFQERCSRDDLIGQVMMAKAFLGEGEWKDMIGEMKLLAVENIQIQGDSATAEVTSELSGEAQRETEYYVREDGKWRLAPAPGSEGCDTSAPEEQATPTATPTGTPTKTPKPTASPAATLTPTPQATAAGPAGQSRGDPIPLGQTLQVPPGWEVTVVDVNPDAWPVVQAENMFNDPPQEGYRMVLITLHVANVQVDDEAESIGEGDFELVGSRGQVYKTYERSCGVTPNDLSAELFPGGAAEGTVCFQAGIDETDLVLIADIGFSFTEKTARYFALE